MALGGAVVRMVGPDACADDERDGTDESRSTPYIGLEPAFLIGERQIDGVIKKMTVLPIRPRFTGRNRPRPFTREQAKRQPITTDLM